LDLLEKSGTGILGILDDMCRTPGASDRGFTDLLYKSCTNSKCFSVDTKQKALQKFTIHHYAGPVEYSSDGFVEKNRDKLPKESTEFLRKSGNSFVQNLAKLIEESVNVADRTAGDTSRKSGATTVGSSFRDQLKNLKIKIEKTAPSYIRCLKPNDLLVPNHFEIPIVAEQLRCGGVLEAVRVARAGFPQHYTHTDFVRRYRPLVWREWRKRIARSSSNTKDVCKTLLDILFDKLQDAAKAENKSNEGQLLQGEPAFAKLGMQVGKSKVFLRQREFEGLERQRGQELQKAAVKLNATFRAYLVRVKWAEYVPLLQREKSDYREDRERKLLQEMEQKAREALSLSDLAANFTGNSDQLLSASERNLVAGKVGSKNPGNRAELIKKGPSGKFDWVEVDGKWTKKYLDDLFPVQSPPQAMKTGETRPLPAASPSKTTGKTCPLPAAPPLTTTGASHQLSTIPSPNEALPIPTPPPQTTTGENRPLPTTNDVKVATAMNGASGANVPANELVESSETCSNSKSDVSAYELHKSESLRLAILATLPESTKETNVRLANGYSSHFADEFSSHHIDESSSGIDGENISKDHKKEKHHKGEKSKKSESKKSEKKKSHKKESHKKERK